MKKTILAALLGGAIAGGAVLTLNKPEITHPRPFLIMDIMHLFQRYADKIYFAGKEHNQRLTGWYLWKLEQSALHAIEHRTEPWHPDFINEGELFQSMLIPAIRELESVVEAGAWADFPDAYEGLVTTCNGCHLVTEHEYVKIRVPDSPIYSNQDYSQPE